MNIHLGKVLFWCLLEFFLYVVAQHLGGEELDGWGRGIIIFVVFNVLLFMLLGAFPHGFTVSW